MNANISARTMWIVAGALVIATLAGCVASPGFRCQQSVDCTGGPDGVCEQTGYCSFADVGCSSGRRYGAESGDLANACTDSVSPPIDGGPDAADDGDGSIPDASVADADVIDYTPSNIPADRLTAGTDDLRFATADGEVVIDTTNMRVYRRSDDGNLRPAGVVVTELSPPEGVPLLVLAARNVIIEVGVTVSVSGTRALVIAAGEDVTIDGVLDLTGGRATIATPGPGGFAGGGVTAPIDGRGPGGGKGVSVGDAGGGGGGYRSPGGAGGDRGASTAGGAGGSANGSADLVPLIGGSGGGAGGDSNMRGVGGGGGGAIQISARGTLRLGDSGVINVGGGGGGGGAGIPQSTSDDAGGGGGSGGAILLEAKRLVLTGVLAANGGGGGAGANGPTAAARGETGKPAAMAAAGGPGAGRGGGGGAGNANVNPPSGGDGVDVAGTTESDNGGGGGGSGGRIRLNAVTKDLRGIVSPTAGMTEGTL